MYHATSSLHNFSFNIPQLDGNISSELSESEKSFNNYDWNESAVNDNSESNIESSLDETVSINNEPDFF